MAWSECWIWVADAVGMNVQVKLLRSILGDKAPQCPKLDISVNIWETVLHLILGDSKDKDGKWGLGYDAVFNPYNDDVSFMAGALCRPVMPRLMTNAFGCFIHRLMQAHMQQCRLGIHDILTMTVAHPAMHTTRAA